MPPANSHLDFVKICQESGSELFVILLLQNFKAFVHWMHTNLLF